MSVQTTYSDNIAAGKAGAVANMVPSSLISRTVETAAGVGFGLAVSQGTEDYGVVVFNDADYVGITVRERSVSAGQDSYAQYDTACVITQGEVSCVAVDAVSAGDPVHILATGTLSNTGGDVIDDAVWGTSASAGGIAVVRLGVSTITLA